MRKSEEEGEGDRREKGRRREKEDGEGEERRENRVRRKGSEKDREGVRGKK